MYIVIYNLNSPSSFFFMHGTIDIKRARIKIHKHSALLCSDLTEDYDIAIYQQLWVPMYASGLKKPPCRWYTTPYCMGIYRENMKNKSDVWNALGRAENKVIFMVIKSFAIEFVPASRWVWK